MVQVHRTEDGWRNVLRGMCWWGSVEVMGCWWREWKKEGRWSDINGECCPHGGGAGRTWGRSIRRGLACHYPGWCRPLGGRWGLFLHHTLQHVLQTQWGAPGLWVPLGSPPRGSPLAFPRGCYPHRLGETLVSRRRWYVWMLQRLQALWQEHIWVAALCSTLCLLCLCVMRMVLFTHNFFNFLIYQNLN